MATVNRVFGLYSESYVSPLESYTERGLIIMPSYKTKQMRETVAPTEIHPRQVD